MTQLQAEITVSSSRTFQHLGLALPPGYRDAVTSSRSRSARRLDAQCSRLDHGHDALGQGFQPLSGGSRHVWASFN